MCEKKKLHFSPDPGLQVQAEQIQLSCILQMSTQRVELLHHPDVSFNLFFFNFGLDAVGNWVKTLTTPPEM